MGESATRATTATPRLAIGSAALVRVFEHELGWPWARRQPHHKLVRTTFPQSPVGAPRPCYRISDFLEGASFFKQRIEAAGLEDNQLRL
jgi:hypothetical protein